MSYLLLFVMFFSLTIKSIKLLNACGKQFSFNTSFNSCELRTPVAKLILLERYEDVCIFSTDFFFYLNSSSQKLEKTQEIFVGLVCKCIEGNDNTKYTHTCAEKFAKITKMLLAKQPLAVHLCGPSIELFEQKHVHTNV